MLTLTHQRTQYISTMTFRFYWCDARRNVFQVSYPNNEKDTDEN